MGLLGKLMGMGGGSSEALVAKIQAGAKIVDVRSPAEFADGHYAKAINIPVNTLQGRYKDFGLKDKPIIVYCASGARSAMAARMLKAEGFTDVTNGGGLSDMPKV